MSLREQVGSSMNRLWDQVSEGWQHLVERAGDALTHFTPTHTGDEADREASELVRRSSKWGLLAAEVKEDDNNIVIKVEAPGMEAGDFDIQVLEGHLIIKGEKKFEKEETKGKFYTMERAYGCFQRVIPIPVDVDDEKAKAKYRRGILAVTLPKSDKPTQQRIQVNS